MNLFAALNINIPWHVAAIAGLAIAVFGLRYGVPKLIEMGKQRFSTLLTLTAMFATLFGGTWAYRWHQANLFSSEFEDYVVAAYNADDAETAAKYMKRAARWLKVNGAQDGPEQTAVLYEGHKYNVHDWAKIVLIADALVTERGEQVAASPGQRELDAGKDEKPWCKDMVQSGLITLVKDQPVVNSPPGISMYPNNGANFLATFVTGLGMVLLAGLSVAVGIKRRHHEGKLICNHCGHDPSSGVKA